MPKLNRFMSIMVSITFLGQGVMYAWDSNSDYLRALAVAERKGQGTQKAAEELINTLSNEKEREAIRKIGDDPNLKAVYEAALYFLRQGTRGVGRLARRAVANGRYVEEYLGELVEAKAVEDHVPYSKIVDLNFEYIGNEQIPEIDFILEVDRTRYKDRAFPSRDTLPDGIYLGESKTHGKGEILQGDSNGERGVIEITMADKLTKYKLSAQKMKKKAHNVKGVIFAIGGEIIPYNGVNVFSLTQLEPGVGDTVLELSIFLALIPNEIINRGPQDNRVLTQIESDFVSGEKSLIEELYNAKKIKAEDKEEFERILTNVVLEIGIGRTRFSIMNLLKDLSATRRDKQTREHWRQVFNKLRERAAPVKDHVSQMRAIESQI